jgi:NitT/TauT family transport system substrate-binding protein
MDGRPARLVPLVLACLLLAGGCGSGGSSTSTASGGTTPANVTIAYQPGIGYASLIVMKQQKVLEKQYPTTTFEWKILAGGSAIRDGIVAGQIQVGAGGIGPFLIGWDKGVGWKLLASLSEMDLWLVARDPAIQSLRDFKPDMKIGMPAPDSIQAIVLRKAAQEQLGNARALDNNIIAIAHPEGVQALASGQLAGHLTSPPFQNEEVQAGGHVVLRSFDQFGRSTFSSVFMTQSFYDQYPQLARAFYQGVVDATRLINEKPDEVAKLLAAEQDNKVPPEQLKAWMSDAGVSYSTLPHGFMKYAEFMKTVDLISKVPAAMTELELPPLAGAGD